MQTAGTKIASHSRIVGDAVPFSRIHAKSTKPAIKNRMLANRSGGTSRTPTRIARKVDPQTKYMIENASKVFHTGGRTKASMGNRSLAGTVGRRVFLLAEVPKLSPCKFPHELPIQIPTANTSTPPTTTWNAAESSGVSI